ncbi:hypothetical protein VZG28_04910 [Synechococcus elongatus IITB4]|uniref:hypothetical protein n=1 Tax=Synechococcus elongatus TaxID=32046 RepID=UPI0030D339EC
MSDIIKLGPLALHQDGNYIGLCFVTGDGYGERRSGLYARCDHAVEAFGTIDEETRQKHIKLFGQRVVALTQEQTTYAYMEKQMKLAAQKNVEEFRDRDFVAEAIAEQKGQVVEVTPIVEQPKSKSKAKSNRRKVASTQTA